ncbi:hypothetical protein [Lacinutrix jangbogonensis]|uniref:hypothetical protein n=1 Tax=Lacinutrix jangbogonensis TaxID=1469557 RepID=UPI00053D601B|nr:hypothetical protein [Lacinutrix jangbogonensis]
MSRLKPLISILILTITFSSCENKKSEEKTNSKTELEKVELSKKVFTESEIAKYTVSAIMNQPPEIIKVKNNDGIYYVSYTRKDDGKKFDYKVKISGNKVTWGNGDGKWRDTKFDEKIKYSEKGNELKIIQTFEDGSEIVKEFTKNESKIDSLIQSQQKIAVGNINFGITEKKYKKEEKIFLEKTKGKLGYFKFRMRPDFYDDERGLRHLRLYGETRDYNYFYKSGIDNYNSLRNIIIKKYGKPTNNSEYDNLPRTEWIIGNKKINLSIIEIDYEYTMQLYFKYETELEKNKLEKGIYEREKKSIEEAINNL